jgi:hypothetical protein
MDQAANGRTAGRTAGPRVIVVPRPLAAHFHERLSRVYGDRTDVRVIVDRRNGDRRTRALGPLDDTGERRNTERRLAAPSWSLADMPARVAGDPAAAGSAA